MPPWWPTSRKRTSQIRVRAKRVSNYQAEFCCNPCSGHALDRPQETVRPLNLENNRRVDKPTIALSDANRRVKNLISAQAALAHSRQDPTCKTRRSPCSRTSPYSFHSTISFVLLALCAFLAQSQSSSTQADHTEQQCARNWNLNRFDHEHHVCVIRL